MLPSAAHTDAAMSQQNVEIVGELFDAMFVRHDPALLDGGIPETVDPEIEIDWSNSKMPIRGVYGFRDAIRMFQRDVDVWEEWRTDPEEMIDAGDQVVVPPTCARRARGAASRWMPTALRYGRCATAGSCA